MVICLEQGADLHMAQLMPLLPTVSCSSNIQIGFTFLVPAHPGSPGQRAVKRVCVCVCSFPILTLDSIVQLSEMFEVCTVSKDLLVLLQASCCSNAVLMYACFFAAFLVFRFLGIFSTQEANGY